jgi:hypothetical protein
MSTLFFTEMKFQRIGHVNTISFIFLKHHLHSYSTMTSTEPNLALIEKRVREDDVVECPSKKPRNRKKKYCRDINALSEHLPDEHIVFRKNVSCCRSCGHADFLKYAESYFLDRWPNAIGYCFFHMQSKDSAEMDGKLTLNVGSFKNTRIKEKTENKEQLQKENRIKTLPVIEEIVRIAKGIGHFRVGTGEYPSIYEDFVCIKYLDMSLFYEEVDSNEEVTYEAESWIDYEDGYDSGEPENNGSEDETNDNSPEIKDNGIELSF